MESLGSKKIFKSVGARKLATVMVGGSLGAQEMGTTALSRDELQRQKISLLNREIEDLIHRKENLHQEILERVSQSESSIQEKIFRAEEKCFERLQIANQECEEILRKAEERAKKIQKDSQIHVEEVLAQSKRDATEAIVRAEEEGRIRGFDEALRRYSEEVDHIVSRFRGIVAEVVNKKNQIIDRCEKDIMEVVMDLAKKVVKFIAAKDEKVVLRNITSALKKAKQKGKITIRINTEDVQLSNASRKLFAELVENVDDVTFVEDPNMEKGGCVVETLFGDVDASISSQLKEIEKAVRRIDAVKFRTGSV